MTNPWKGIPNRSRLMFQWRYFRRQTPWDTDTTPPEVIEFIKKTPPGRALDLGCGTGTNAITLASHGWEVTGVDFVKKAIRAARQKAAKAGCNIDFHVADVTDLSMLSDVYDYALDIGCMFTLSRDDQMKYAETLAGLLRPEGWYMLYAWLPRLRKGKIWGISTETVEALLKPSFIKLRCVVGEESGYPTAWYWFQRR